MRLRILGRHDSLLLAGLTFALLVVFQPSVQYVLDVAQEIERHYGVALVPALVILSVMFIFHQQANRREMRAEAASAASEASLARARAQELEHLMLFSQALARALSIDGVRETAWLHLPKMTGTNDIWVLLRTDTGWERLTDTGRNRWAEGEIEVIADEVVTQSPDRLAVPDGIEQSGHTCFAMMVGPRALGIVGILAPEASLDIRRKTGAAAALLGVALRNVQLFAEVRDNSVKDVLTGCFNRAHTLEILDGELARARRSNAPLSVVMFDVDNFKKINDAHGHASGDSVLAAVGQRIRHVLRRSDVRCRYGGDEFLVILPETGEAGALRVGEWLRTEIEQIQVSSPERVKPTISVGVATAHSGEMTGAALVDRADRALYEAKAAGRNCVRAAAPGSRTIAAISSLPATGNFIAH
jgi:diguanylate cyclase (GGDEF)-like protein